MPNSHTTHDTPDETSGPSGATDRGAERTQKFDEEGGDQPQAPSQGAVERELEQIQRQQQPGLSQAQGFGRSMGSAGRAHFETGQQPHPEPFEKDQGEVIDDTPVDRETFRYQQRF